MRGSSRPIPVGDRHPDNGRPTPRNRSSDAIRRLPDILLGHAIPVLNAMVRSPRPMYCCYTVLERIAVSDTFSVKYFAARSISGNIVLSLIATRFS